MNIKTNLPTVVKGVGTKKHGLLWVCTIRFREDGGNGGIGPVPDKGPALPPHQPDIFSRDFREKQTVKEAKIR